MRTACGRRSQRVIELERQGESLALALDDAEATLLRRLADELRSVVSGGQDTDSVQRRLFPDAYESPDDSRAFRDLVESELRTGKLATLDRVSSDLGPDGAAHVVLDTEGVTAWLTALTDMRLAIGTRLDVDEEKMAAELDKTDESFAPLWVLHWLGWVQESLLREEMGT